MPRKARVPKVRITDANPFLVNLLIDGELVKPCDDESADGYWAAFTATHPGARGEYFPHVQREWSRLREQLLVEWIEQHPGTRPHGWWVTDAPRWRGPYPDRQLALAWHLCLIAEPRHRLGGIGTPCYEVLNVWPEFRFGIPLHWVSAEGPLGDGGVAPRVDDPPMFESQASYLLRHRLLDADEQRTLTDDAFAPEPLDVTLFEDA